LVGAIFATSLIHLADGQSFTALLGGSGQEYASSVATDGQGNIYAAGQTYSSDFPVTAGALQSKSAGNSEVIVAKFAANGTLLWSTYLGGTQDEWASGVAVDRAGNVLVTGWTRSGDFPLFHAVQSTLNNGASLTDYDAFVTKIDPTGTRLIYSTFLGGAANDGANGIAVDASGNAYVTVDVNSAAAFPGTVNAPAQFGIVVSKLDPQGTLVYSFFHPNGHSEGIAVDAAGSAYITGSAASVNPSSTTQMFGAKGSAYAMVFKLSADGSKKLYETGLGGSVHADGAAVAVDSTGVVYVAGSTASVDFPLMKPFQNTLGARPLWKSTDSGTTWKPLDALPFALPRMLLVDPTTPGTLYVSTADLGIFKSLDGAVTWTQVNTGIANPAPTLALAIDALHPQTLYAATGSGSGPSYVYKSVNGGGAWSLIDSRADGISELAVDAQNSSIYAVGAATRKSTDGGVTWATVPFPGTSIQSVSVDPRVAGNLFAISTFVFIGPFANSTPSFIYRTADGGPDWTQITSVAPASPGLIVDGSTNPSTVYDGFTYRSTDGGVTWPKLPPSPLLNGNGARRRWIPWERCMGLSTGAACLFRATMLRRGRLPVPRFRRPLRRRSATRRAP
jgi:hypothetical protein